MLAERALSSGKENMSEHAAAKKAKLSHVAIKSKLGSSSSDSKGKEASKALKQSRLSFSKHMKSNHGSGFSVRLPSVMPIRPADSPKTQLSKKRSSAAIVGAMTRKLQQTSSKPSHAAPPTFCKVALPAEPLFSLRLQLREFVTRFEGLFSHVPQKHLSWICDPFTDLEFLSFRHLAAAMLRLMQEKQVEPLLADITILRLALQEVEKATVRNGQLWPVVIDFLGHQKVLKASVKRFESSARPALENATINTDSEGDLSSEHSDVSEPEEIFDMRQQLSIMTDLMHVCLQCEAIRKDLDAQQNAVKTVSAQHIKDRMALKAEYEVAKQELHAAQFKTSNKKEVKAWQDRWVAAKEEHERKLAALDIELFTAQRAARLRSRPVGEDVLGNVYWIFGDRARDTAEKDLGCRVVVMPGAGRCGPECEAKDNDHADCQQIEISHDPLASLFDDDKIVPSGNGNRSVQAWWFEVRTSAEIKKLGAWIAARAHHALPSKPKQHELAKLQKNAASAAEASGSPAKEAPAKETLAPSAHASSDVNLDDDIDELDILQNAHVPATFSSKDADLLDGSESDLTDLSDLSDLIEKKPTLEKSQALWDQWQQVEALVSTIELFGGWLATVQQDEGQEEARQS